MTIHIGTSGWQYRHWRERFYVTGLAQSKWLEYYADGFATVESNAAFYRLPEKSTFESWARRTPDDFVWTVKMSRYLTHVRRLREPAEAVARFLERVAGLGDKLGPVLLQLPPTLRADLAALDDVLGRLDAAVKVAVEFRHESWFTDETRDLLAERGAALCLADRASRRVAPMWATAGWGYVRLHHGRATPEPCYGPSALRTWARDLARLWAPGAEVFVFFNNDPRGCALRDARAFAGHVRRAGLTPTRVPATDIAVD